MNTKCRVKNRLNWRDYVRKPNPVAGALMAKMRIAPVDRPRVKLECLRMIVTLKLDSTRATLISAFMDSYLRLTAAETAVYNREIEAIDPKEREVVMEWTNEWIEKGKAEGKAQGKVEGLLVGELNGRAAGQRDILIRQLRRRLGADADTLRASLEKLSSDKMDELAEDLLDFKTLGEMPSDG